MGAPSDGKGKKKKSQDISRLAKATPTRIPHTQDSPKIIPHQQEAKLERLQGRLLGGLGAIIFVFTIVLYTYSLYGVPVFNDDMNLQAYMRSFNASVFWAQQVASVLSAPLAQSWVKLTYGLDAISFPKMPAWYHLVNVLLHAFASLYFYFFVLQLGLRLRAEKRSTINAYVFAFCAALLFASHPLGTGAVAYISGRGALLTACNYFLCLNLFLLAFYSQKVWHIVALYITSLVFYFIGIACGFQMLSLPLVLSVLVTLLKPENLDAKTWFKERFQDFGAIVLYGVTSVIVLLTAREPLLDNGVDLMQMAHVGYAASCCKSFVSYFLRCFVVPAGLSIEPSFTVAQNFADPLSILGALILLGGACSIFLLKRTPFLTVALTLASLPFIVDLCFVQHEFVSDQKFYIALAGLSLAVCSSVFEWTASIKVLQSKQAIAGGMVLLAILSGLTVWRQNFWLTNASIWNGKQESPRGQAEYGRILLNSGKQEEAEKTEREALEKDPECPNAHEVLGQLFLSKKQYGKAVKEFEQALESCAPRKTAFERRIVYQEQLVNACIQAQDYAKASKNLTSALMAYPGSANLHLYAGQILLGQQQPLMALQELQSAYKMDPSNSLVVEPLVQSLLDVGGAQYVRTAYQLAYQGMAFVPTSKLKCLFARAAIDLGRIKQAVPRLQLVLKDEPNNAEALYLTSIIFHLTGEEKTAIEYKRQALAQNPNIEKLVIIHPELPKPETGGKPDKEVKTGVTPSSNSPKAP